MVRCRCVDLSGLKRHPHSTSVFFLFFDTIPLQMTNDDDDDDDDSAHFLLNDERVEPQPGYHMFLGRQTNKLQLKTPFFQVAKLYASFHIE